MPALLVCPNCGSSKIGKEPGEPEYYCDACTSFFDEPKELLTTEDNLNKKVEDGKMAVKGKCVNCLRDGLTLPQAHMCGGCNSRVKGLKKDSAEYIAALAKAKKDFNDPDYKSGRGKGNRKPKIKTDRKANQQKAAMSPVSCPVPCHPPPTSDYEVISVLCTQRDFHLAQADKLNKAIELLS